MIVRNFSFLFIAALVVLSWTKDISINVSNCFLCLFKKVNTLVTHKKVHICLIFKREFIALETRAQSFTDCVFRRVQVPNKLNIEIVIAITRIECAVCGKRSQVVHSCMQLSSVHVKVLNFAMDRHDNFRKFQPIAASFILFG